MNQRQWIGPVASLAALGALVLSSCSDASSSSSPAAGASSGGSAGAGAGSAGKASSGGAPPSTGGTAQNSGGTTSSTGGSAAGSGAAGRGGSGQGGGSGGQGQGGAGGSSGGVASGGVAGGMDGGAPASGCAGRDYILCEDFEDTDVGEVPDGWERHGDEANVDDDDARSGARSLKLGAIDVWERRIYHDAAELGSAHWGRIYYKVDLPVPDAFVHSTMVALHGDGPENGESEYRVVDTVKQAVDTPDVGSSHQFLWNVQPEDSGEFGDGTSYDWFFEEEWHCVEYFIDGENQAYRFYFEGEEEIAFENGPGNYDDSDIPTSFDELRVGWINYQESPPGFTAWIDDIAFDDERIGCE